MMIASVAGTILHKDRQGLVIDVGGVGLAILVPAPLLDRLSVGEQIFLYTHLVLRQDSIALFGFDTIEGRDIFTMLLSVDGIGPRLALAILSSLTPDTIRRAIFNEQADIFSRVPGVGKKTAQKILVSLQDRITAEEGFEPIAVMSEIDSEVLSALITLGYSVVEAQAALQSIPRDAPEDLEERLRLALAYFS
jgi:Holliday junction DNA helicase RuvA